MRAPRSFAPALVVAALGACGTGAEGTSTDEQDIQASADSTDGVSTTSSLFAITADPAASTMVPAAAATAAQGAAQGFFQPAGCLSSRTEGAAVVYTFNNCTGPYGLVNLQGTLRATFSNPRPNGWTVTLTGNLMANRASLTPNATAVIAYAGSTRTAMVTLMGGGTGPRGTVYTNSGSYTSTWDGNCLGLTGSVTTSARGANLTTTVGNYQRCRGECPRAGGTVAFTASSGRAITITYSGRASATVSGARGSITVPLFCGSAQ